MNISRTCGALVALAVLASCDSQTPKPSTQPTPAPAASNTADPSEQRIAQGEELYNRYCKLCHGEDAVGYAADHASQLRNPAFLASANYDLIWFGIEYGRPGTPMAAFGKSQGGPLDEPQIRAIVEYLKSLGRVRLDNETVVGDAERGAAPYGTHCARCHGARGEGSSTAPSLNNPYFLASASDGFLRYAIQYGRPETPMKPYDGVLHAQQIADIVRLIRSWARNVDYGPTAGEPIPPLSSLVQHPSGRPAAFTLRDGRYVSVDQVVAELKAGARMVLLDARATSDWMNSHIPGAYPAPFYDPLSPELLKAIPRDGTWIVAYCACPHAASDRVADMLRNAGFKNVVVLNEGLLEWAKRGYPVTFGRSSGAGH